jgi:hypothetical protein
MDPTEIRHLFNREARRLFEKSARSPPCESPLKIPRHLVQLLEIKILIANSPHSSVSDLLFTTYSCWQRR